MTAVKQVITIRLDPMVLDFIDYNARSNGESRSTIINHMMKGVMKGAGVSLPNEEIIIEAPEANSSGNRIVAKDVMSRVR